MRYRTALAVPAALLLGASAAASQTIGGTVVDAATGERVPAADVVAHLDGRRVARAATDPSGRFSLDVRRGGRYRLSVTRLGYEPLDSAYVELAWHESVEVTLRLSTEPVALEPLTVTARGVALRHRATWEGFVRRYQDRQPVGGVRLALRDDPEFFPLMTVEDWLRGVRLGGGCTRILMDGTWLYGWQGIEAGDTPALSLSTQMVDAVEYYRRPLDAPLEYREHTNGLPCGILVIWRRQDRSVEGSGGA